MRRIYIMLFIFIGFVYSYSVIESKIAINENLKIINEKYEIISVVKNINNSYGSDFKEPLYSYARENIFLETRDENGKINILSFEGKNEIIKGNPIKSIIRINGRLGLGIENMHGDGFSTAMILKRNKGYFHFEKWNGKLVFENYYSGYEKVMDFNEILKTSELSLDFIDWTNDEKYMFIQINSKDNFVVFLDNFTIKKIDGLDIKSEFVCIDSSDYGNAGIIKFISEKGIHMIYINEYKEFELLEPLNDDIDETPIYISSYGKYIYTIDVHKKEEKSNLNLSIYDIDNKKWRSLLTHNISGYNIARNSIWINWNFEDKTAYITLDTNNIYKNDTDVALVDIESQRVKRRYRGIENIDTNKSFWSNEKLYTISDGKLSRVI